MYEFNDCHQEYFKKWVAANMEQTLSQEEFDTWYDEHCGKCPKMGIICMADEV